MPLVGSEDNLDFSDCLSQDEHQVIKADTGRDLRLESGKFIAADKKTNSAGKRSRRRSSPELK